MRVLSLLVVTLAAGDLWADTEVVNGIEWTYRINGETAEIGYGNGRSAISTNTTGSLTIPTTLGGKPVTSIGAYAFSGCSGLTGVTIPDGVMSIGKNAFARCRGLTSMTIPDSVTNVTAGAFSSCPNISSLTIPQCVCADRLSKVFSAKKKITDIVISPGVTNIGDHAFSYCSALRSVTIPDGVTCIGKEAFYSCGKLTSVTIPDGVTSIGELAFFLCVRLTVVEIPSSVTTIGRKAFYHTAVLRRDDGGSMNYGGVVDDVRFSKAQTKNGALYNASGELVGIVELKFGRVNARKGTVKVSASATLLTDGRAKKMSAKAVTMKDGGTDAPLVFRAPIGRMELLVAEDGAFTLANYDYKMIGGFADGSGADGAIRVMEVGGRLEKNLMKFNVAIDSVPDFGMNGELLEAALPNDEPVHVSRGTKWSFDRAAALRYAKDRATGSYGLVGLDDPSKPNLSSLKLTYTAKTGLFRGSFKLYTTNAETMPEGKSPKLKKFTVNVAGLVVDGVGHGWAALKKPYAVWSVTVE